MGSASGTVASGSPDRNPLPRPGRSAPPGLAVGRRGGAVNRPGGSGTGTSRRCPPPAGAGSPLGPRAAHGVVRRRRPAPGRAARRPASSSTPVDSPTVNVHTEYTSSPPGRTRSAAAPSSRRCRAASRSTAAGSTRQRRSARRRSVPSPEHGASTRTRSNDPGRHGGRVPSADHDRHALGAGPGDVRRHQAGATRPDVGRHDPTHPSSASAVALPPGAAHRSSTRSPGRGADGRRHLLRGRVLDVAVGPFGRPSPARSSPRRRPRPASRPSDGGQLGQDPVGHAQPRGVVGPRHRARRPRAAARR